MARYIAMTDYCATGEGYTATIALIVAKDEIVAKKKFKSKINKFLYPGIIVCEFGDSGAKQILNEFFSKKVRKNLECQNSDIFFNISFNWG